MSSLKSGADICSPNGRPDLLKPQGIDIAFKIIPREVFDKRAVERGHGDRVEPGGSRSGLDLGTATERGWPVADRARARVLAGL